MAIVHEGQQRAGLRAYALACTYCFVSLIFGMQLSLCGPTASLLAAQTGGTEADLAPVLGCGGIGMIIGGLPSGWITDRFPGHTVLAVSHCVQGIGFFLIPLCRSVTQLAIVYGTISLTFSATNTALNCMAIWLLTPVPGQPEPPMTVAFLLNTVSAMFGVGALAAPQIVLLMDRYTGSGMNIFYIAVGMSAVIILAFSMLPASPRAPPPLDEDSLTPSTPGSYAYSTVSHSRGSRQLPPTAVTMPQPVLSRQNSLEPRIGAHSRNASWARNLRQSKSGGSSVHGDSLAQSLSTALHSGQSNKAGQLAGDAAAHLVVHVHRAHEHAARQKKWKGPFLAAALLLVFANISIELGFGNWIFTYCVRQADLSEDAGQQITSLFWLAFTLGRVPAMIMVAYVSVSTIMAITMPLAIIGALVPLVFEKSMPGGGGIPPPAPLALPGFNDTIAAGAASAVALSDDGKQLTTLFVVVATILVACGSAAGTPCTLSLATEYITVDGFINGLIGTVAGVGATTFPYVVPVLAKAIPSLGFQCLMAATLVMALLQIGSLVAMLSFGKAMGRMADFDELLEEDHEHHHHQHHHHHHIENHGDSPPHRDCSRISEKPSELEEPLLRQAGPS